MANLLNLVWWTIVKRRERNRVADFLGIGQIAILLPAVRNLGAQFLDVRLRITQTRDEIADRRAGDALHIVAETEIVNRRRLVERAWLELQEVARLEHLDEHHAGD